jgi:hypothetical protein
MESQQVAADEASEPVPLPDSITHARPLKRAWGDASRLHGPDSSRHGPAQLLDLGPMEAVSPPRPVPHHATSPLSTSARWRALARSLPSGPGPGAVVTAL